MRVETILLAIDISRIPVCDALRSDTPTRDLLLSTDSLPFPAPESEMSRWRFLLRPLTFSLLCLAIAVVIWGLEYEMSLYCQHSRSPARASVAKLWVGPRAGLSNASVRAKSTLQFVLGLHGSLPRNISFFLFSDAVSNAPQGSTDARFCLLLGTLRSPPGSYL